jgi:hypothetical protein
MSSMKNPRKKLTTCSWCGRRASDAKSVHEGITTAEAGETMLILHPGCARALGEKLVSLADRQQYIDEVTG